MELIVTLVAKQLNDVGNVVGTVIKCRSAAGGKDGADMGDNVTCTRGAKVCNQERALSVGVVEGASDEVLEITLSYGRG